MESTGSDITSMRTYYAESPEELITIADQIRGEAVASSQYLRLRLLQPLTYWEVLARNRNPESRWMTDGRGNRLAPSMNEHIVHDDLSKHWRKAWSTVPPSVGRVTFDLTLEQGNKDGGRVEWLQMVARDAEGYEIRLNPQGLGLLVATLSIGMSMRSRGSVQMDVATHDLEQDGFIKESLAKLMSWSRTNQ